MTNTGTTDIRNVIPDLEPDDAWKQNLRDEIELGLSSMVADAKRMRDSQLKEAPVDEVKRNFLSEQHIEAMKNIRRIAVAQFDDALDRERYLRRWSHGLEGQDEFNDALVKEQQSILDNIKGQTDRSRTNPLNSIGELSPESPTEVERPGQRPIQRPINRQAHFPEGSNSRRPSASSPPKMMPEFWKPTISPEEDAAISTPYAIARRGSTASTGSVGSSTFRSSISSQTIPERTSDVAVDFAGNEERERVMLQEVDHEWGQLAKGREKERALHSSKLDSRQSTSTESQNQRREEPVAVQSPTTPSRPTDGRAFQSSLSASRPIVPKRSFIVDDSSRVDSRIHQSPPANRPLTNMRSFTADDASRNYHPPSRSIVPQRSFTVDETARADGRGNLFPSTSRQSAGDTSRTPRSIVTQRSFTTDETSRTDGRSNHSPSGRNHPPPSSAPRSAVTQRSSVVDETTRGDGRSNQSPPASRPMTNQRSLTVDDINRADTRGNQYPTSTRRQPANQQSFIKEDANHTDSRTSQTPLFGSSPAVNQRSSTSADANHLDSRVHQSPAASRSLTNQRPLVLGDSVHYPVSSPRSARWTGAPSSPNDGRFEHSSPQSSNENPRKLQSPISSLSHHDSHRDPNEHGSVSRPDVGEEGSDSDEDDDDAESIDQTFDDIEVQTKRREEEAERKEAEAKRKEEDARLREEGAMKTVEEARRKEEEAKRKEEEAKRKEEEAKRKEEEAKRKEEEAQRIEEAARLKALETQKKEEEVRLREEEVKRREEELNRREAEARRKEDERRQEEDERRRREDNERRLREEGERLRKVKEDEKNRKEEEYRKRAEEIQRRAEERKQQESMSFENIRTGSSFPPSSSTPSGAHWFAGTSPPTSPDRSSTTSSNRSSASSTWSSSTQASSASRSSATPTAASKPSSARTDTPGMGSFSSSVPPSFPSSTQTDHEREWARRQADLAKEQQEKFRREQERLERERQAKMATAGRIPTKDEVIRLFATHERQWSMLPNQGDLRWDSFPWPMLKMANNPTDLTEGAIGAYVGSPFHPGDKSKSMKERIKDHIRRWHPDRFDTRLLPKVVEEERAIVKEGAGAVVRSLTNLLMANSNVRDVFS
jgi:hypothetical protein